MTIETIGTGSIKLVSVETASAVGGVLKSNLSAKVTLPTAYALHQNFPNPFNPSTRLSADFPQTSRYTLSIYNITGQIVKTFGGQAEAGTLTVTWDGADNSGSQVASGVYFYRLETEAFESVRKMLLMK